MKVYVRILLCIDYKYVLNYIVVRLLIFLLQIYLVICGSKQCRNEDRNVDKIKKLFVLRGGLICF